MMTPKQLVATSQLCIDLNNVVNDEYALGVSISTSEIIVKDDSDNIIGKVVGGNGGFVFTEKTMKDCCATCKVLSPNFHCIHTSRDIRSPHTEVCEEFTPSDIEVK